MKKIALLWAEPSLGLYSNRSFDELFRGCGHNTGNLAFVHAVRSHLVGEVGVLPWHAGKAALDPYDIAVIPCANQLGPHTDMGKLGQVFAAHGKPIVAIGLGAQAKSLDLDVEVNEGTLAWVKAIDGARAGSGPNIWTRGPYTTQQLERLGIPGAMTGACPSALISPATDLGQRIHAHWSARPAPRAISVAAGHQSWGQARTVEQQLIAMMQDSINPGQYVVQSAMDMVRAARWEFDAIEQPMFQALKRHCAPHLNGEEFKAWWRMYGRAYWDVPSWMESLRRHDLAIGPRYHGTALALQAERMGVCITIDSRTEELCMQTGVPYFRATSLDDKPLTRATLKKMIAFDPAAYDAARARLAASYIGFLAGNGLEAADFVKRIADAA